MSKKDLLGILYKIAVFVLAIGIIVIYGLMAMAIWEGVISAVLPYM